MSRPPAAKFSIARALSALELAAFYGFAILVTYALVRSLMRVL